MEIKSNPFEINKTRNMYSNKVGYKTIVGKHYNLNQYKAKHVSRWLLVGKLVISIHYFYVMMILHIPCNRHKSPFSATFSATCSKEKDLNFF